MTVALKRVLLSSHQPLEAGLGWGTCGWEGNNDQSLFLPGSCTFSNHWLVAQVSRNPKNQALRGEFRRDEGLVADNTNAGSFSLVRYRCGFSPIVRGPLPRMASTSWPLTLSPEVLISAAHLAPTLIWGSRSTLPTGRLVSVCLPCHLLEAEAAPNTSSNNGEQLPLF